MYSELSLGDWKDGKPNLDMFAADLETDLTRIVGLLVLRAA